jgi:hypothetical protein
MFYRINSDGNAEVYNDDGSAATRIKTGNVYPVGSDLSTHYEHPEGIVLTIADAEKISIHSENYRDQLATELLVGCPAESLADHKKIAAAIRNGDSVSNIEDLCGDFYPETAVWIRNRLS